MATEAGLPLYHWACFTAQERGSLPPPPHSYCAYANVPKPVWLPIAGILAVSAFLLKTAPPPHTHTLGCLHSLFPIYTQRVSPPHINFPSLCSQPRHMQH